VFKVDRRATVKDATARRAVILKPTPKKLLLNADGTDCSIIIGIPACQMLLRVRRGEMRYRCLHVISVKVI